MMDQRAIINDPVKRALVEIRVLRNRIADLEAGRNEPVAIVGMGFRFPGGANDAARFADLLWSGTDAVREIGADRWPLDRFYDTDPDAPGKMTTRYGAFLDQVDRFDAEFFGISPREAASMDPQQRLLLEVTWEALENAGHAPAALNGASAGVYLGIANGDYGRALFAQSEAIDTYYSTGNAYSVAAGRLSYVLGARGPAIAVDTACSSSLVALHLACQGLRLGECDLALAGGVNLILTPEMNINFSKAGMMAADGRCKTFDVAADGYVRGEGCGMLVLRRLSDALKDNDRILAVVRGSAINQDGRSSGLTAPNGPSQEAVIRAALAAAQLTPGDIGYVETHGTGTPLGDPIEVGALAAAFGRGRDRPLLIGSVKTNIGHLEAAAGVAGVVKVILALQRGEIPPHLHFRSGNPHIDWSATPITVPVTVTPWPVVNGRRIAGVSSFGFSGTNAHVLIEGPPDAVDAEGEAVERPRHLLALSARDADALAELVRRYQTVLTPEAPVADICFTANAGRSHFAHRLSVSGATSADLQSGLAAFAAGQEDAALVAGHRRDAAAPRIAFLFTGQGAQHAGMARTLYETSTVFRAAFDRCADALAPHLPWPLVDLVFAAADAERINDTDVAHPVNFAIQYALAELWRAWGIEPAVVAGHSLGEYAAACVAGVLPLADAAQLVVARGRVTHALGNSGGIVGGMATVFASPAIVEAALHAAGDGVSIAAYNGPEHVVISGPRAAVEAAVVRFETTGIRAKLLRISFAAHSPFIEPALPAFRAALADVQFHAPRIALVSNVTGELAGRDEIGNADYWLTQMRAPVQFARSVRTLIGQGVTHVIEIGAHPVLLGMAAECVPDETVEWLPSLRRDGDDWQTLIDSLQRLYVAGVDPDWRGFDRGYARRRVALPTYPFRRTRHWIDEAFQHTPMQGNAAERWTRVAAALDRQAERGPLDLNAASYPDKWACLAELTAAHAAHTLRGAGVFLRAGERRTLSDVLQHGGIKPTYRHLLARWLDGLVARGRLRRDGEAYIADVPLAEPDLATLWTQAEQRFADNRPLLDYVRHCGALVGAVVRGAESPLETLFPQGAFDLAENLYERSTTMRYVNALAGAALETHARNFTAARPLRVLEVGAGTGGTTAALLPLLAPQATRYLFTDVTDVFLERGRERFGHYPFVSYALLDIDKDPAGQGIAADGFDVIVSANAIHASTDLRLALDRLRALLAPGGLLILIESTIHLDWFDMTTGLIEGWQHFADDLRTDNPLLPPQTWTTALRHAGFEDADAWPKAGSAAAHLGQHVLVARVAGEASAAVAHAASDVALAQPAMSQTGEPVARLRDLVVETLPADRHDLLCDIVRKAIKSVLKMDGDIGRDERLMDIGMDSLMAVQLRKHLGRQLDLERPLPASLMFDHPTINAIAVHLNERLMPAAHAETASMPVAAITAGVLAVAVIGMSDTEIEQLLAKRFAVS
jgi:acyl transferase domain-containing protein